MINQIDQFFNPDGTLIAIPVKSAKKIAVLLHIARDLSPTTKYPGAIQRPCHWGLRIRIAHGLTLRMWIDNAWDRYSYGQNNGHFSGCFGVSVGCERVVA